MSAGYARTRYQFGRPIGSFQAVKHKCADMLVRVELAEATAREAARLADEAPASSESPPRLRTSAAPGRYMFVAAENIQVHGGIGFTWEHPAHLYFRRAKSSELLFGGPAVYHERLLDRLGILPASSASAAVSGSAAGGSKPNRRSGRAGLKRRHQGVDQAPDCLKDAQIPAERGAGPCCPGRRAPASARPPPRAGPR